MDTLEWAKRIAGVQPDILEEGRKNLFGGKKAEPFAKKAKGGKDDAKVVKDKGADMKNKMFAKINKKKTMKEGFEQWSTADIDAFVAEMFDDDDNGDDEMTSAEQELAKKGVMPKGAEKVLKRAEDRDQTRAMHGVAQEDEESGVSKAAAAAKMSQAGKDAAKSITREGLIADTLALYRKVGGIEDTIDESADLYLVVENMSGRVACCFPDVVSARKFVDEHRKAATFQGYTIEPRHWARPAHFSGKGGY